MPPKRKTKATGKKTQKKQRRNSSSENEASGSDTEAAGGFDKNTLQRCSKYDLEALMIDPSFNHPEFVHSMEPEELTLEWYEENGLDNPIHFKCDPKRIGMTLPSSSFSVNDVLELVGGNRMIEVVQVQDQGSVKMSLQEFVDFYNTPQEKRTTLYNVLSLEYSLTPLEDKVKSPALVRQIDWVGNKWPDALRQRYISFNGRDKKLYNPHHTFPKVQNYCLMSVANCYTDFHIDFSGTSVWYHVLKGKKVFWLIPPTPNNFYIYQEFIKTVGDNAFFGSSAEKCHVAILEPGDTMLIPSGWIHAVYTPEDSLVFGGNFLHSQSIQTQLRVYQVENKLNITRKFRLPYNEELLFYVIADYVKQWTGREYVRPLRIEDAKMDYCGEKWKAAGGHLKKIVYSDYEKGVELTSEMFNEDGGESTSKDVSEVKVIAMHAENSLFQYPQIIRKTSEYTEATGLEEEADEEEDRKDWQPTKEELDALRDAEIDELAATNSLIFYKNSKHDFVRNKCVPDHKLPVGHEPPVYFNDDVISKISPRLLEELEALGAYIRKKARVEVAEGICQPASLINVFNHVLRKRRAELEGKPFEYNQVMPRRYTRAALGSGDYEHEPAPHEAAEQRRRESIYKVEDFPDEILEPERPPTVNRLPEQPCSGPLEYHPTPIVTDDNGLEPEYEEEEEEMKEEEEPEEEEEEEYVAPVTRRSTRRSSAKKEEVVKTKKEKKKKVEEEKEEEEEEEEEPKEEEPEEEADTPKKVKKEKKAPKPDDEAKKEKKAAKEKKKKEKERRELDGQLEAELRAAHGGGSAKSKKKKPEKPAYVGGLPTAPIQNDPVVSNPYNYDPRQEMMKLGTGQLKSAYRKTRNNVELHIEKNLYKLEPKRGSHSGSESREQSTEPPQSPHPVQHHDRYSGYQPQESHYDDYEGGGIQKPPAKRAKLDPISVDTTPVSSKKKDRPSPFTPPPKQHLHPPTTKTASPMYSPSLDTSKTPERRLSDASSAMKKGVYMPAMSRQDKMIAEAAAAASASSSRHSSISSERRPSFIPDLSSTSRHSSIETPLYTPTVPQRSSWLPNTSNITRHSMEDDSPIDVVNDTMSPNDSGTFPVSITPPPVTLKDLKTNGKHRHHRNEEGRRSRIPSKEAVAELKILVGKLKAINDS
uniref:JmjC domain-containing protein n=1 Tax=Caenorhabditis tropicalis TaxID=1561998 RepID=A0A1I7UMM0_9PELO